MNFLSGISKTIVGHVGGAIFSQKHYTESLYYRRFYDIMRCRYPHILPIMYVDSRPVPVSRFGIIPEEMIAFEAQRTHDNYTWWSGSIINWKMFIHLAILGCLATYYDSAGYTLALPRGWHPYLGRILTFRPIGLMALIQIYNMMTKYMLYSVDQHRVFRITNYGRFRTATRRLDVGKARSIDPGHSHPLIAAQRNHADKLVNNLIIMNGFRPYSIQKSLLDHNHGFEGSLRHIWSMDAHSPQCDDAIRPEHVFKLFNVDYYIDWNKYLWMAHSFVIYTFTPQTPCGQYLETSWTTNEFNQIELVVAGGAKYKHELWDYNISSFSSIFPGVTIDYLVETLPLAHVTEVGREPLDDKSKHWSIVHITPVTARRNLTSTIDCGLRRLKIVHEVLSMDGKRRKACLMRRVKNDNELVVCPPGSHTSAIVSSSLQASLHSRLLMGVVKLHDLLPLLQPVYGNDCRKEQAIIYGYFPTHSPNIVPRVHAEQQSFNYHKLQTSSIAPKIIPTGTLIAPPVLDTGWMPSKVVSNDEWTVLERITNMKNERSIGVTYQNYVNEFIRLLIPENVLLAPEELSNIIADQKRPTQVANNTRAVLTLDSWNVQKTVRVKSFQKDEVYSKNAPPRNISTLPTEHCLLYSQYTRALAAYVKQFPWYGFGKHPDIVAQRVHLVAVSAKTLVETDFTRFDGTHSHALYDFELAVMLRAFVPCYHDEIRTLQAAMRNAKAVTTNFVRYNTGGSRLSGAADTSIGNTLDNALISYMTYRRMGHVPNKAFQMLGIYGGDDGISPDVDTKSMEEVVKNLGLSVKAISRPSVQPTNFLGRRYPHPSSSPDHFCDVVRQLAKLHLATYNDADPVLALYNKAMGYVSTDPQTPIISEWAQMVVRVNGQQILTEKYQSWSYMNMYVDGKLTPISNIPSREVMEASVCSDLDITSIDLATYITHLKTITDISQLQPIKTKGYTPAPGVVIGDLLGLEDKVATVPSTPAVQPIVPTLPRLGMCVKVEDGKRGDTVLMLNIFTETTFSVVPKPGIDYKCGKLYDTLSGVLVLPRKLNPYLPKTGKFNVRTRKPVINKHLTTMIDKCTALLLSNMRNQ